MKVVVLWIPRRFLTPSGADLVGFVADINQKIVSRGFIRADGQLLTTPLDRLESSDLTFDGDTIFDTPQLREWREPQREYFGLENPYQMAEDSHDYTQSHVITRVVEPYLLANERIVAIVHGGKDSYYFYCPCHQADVVYTTRHRLVCMGCGATHKVLCTPLPIQAKRLLTADEWVDFFDDGGSRRDEEIEISVIDFRDVEDAESIWTTDQWEEAKRRFIFFARSSPDVVAEAIRGTEADPTILMEAGWSPIDTSPPPAHQVSDDSVDVDLLENAAHSLREGVAAFLLSRKRPELLVTSIPALYRATELLLKAKLHDVDSLALDDRPNNPTVLQRLIAKGVSISKYELDVVNRLRRLRNNLQHGTAKFNYRKGLALCKKTVIFLDRFVAVELGLWIGHEIPPEDWQQLLEIPDVAGTAQQVVDDMLRSHRQHPEVDVSTCPRCGCDALVRTHPRTGASCIYCGHVPVYKDD